MVLRDPTLVACAPRNTVITRPVTPLEPPSLGARAMTPPPPLIDQDGRVVTSPSDAMQMEEDANYERSLLAPGASHRAVREREENLVVTTRAKDPEPLPIRWHGLPETQYARALEDEDVAMEPFAERDPSPLRMPQAPVVPLAAVTMPPPLAGYYSRVTQPLEAETRVPRGAEATRGRGRGILGGLSF